MNTEKKYRVSHFPQVPCKPFEYEVKTVSEAVQVSEAISLYDLFLLANHHRVDYANASIIQEYALYDDEEGAQWYDLDDYEIEELLALEKTLDTL